VLAGTIETEHLQRHLAPRPALLGQIDDAHTTPTQQALDPKAPDALGDRQRLDLAVRHGRHELRGLFEEIVAQIVGRQERAHLVRQLGVSRARSLEARLTTGLLLFEGQVEDFFGAHEARLVGTAEGLRHGVAGGTGGSPHPIPSKRRWGPSAASGCG